jgi:hypothetical protein
MKPPFKAYVGRYVRLTIGKIAGEEVVGTRNYQANQVNLAPVCIRKAVIVDIINDELAGEMTCYVGRIKIAAIEGRLRQSAKRPESRRSRGADQSSQGFSRHGHSPGIARLEHGQRNIGESHIPTLLSHLPDTSKKRTKSFTSEQAIDYFAYFPRATKIQRTASKTL